MKILWFTNTPSQYEQGKHHYYGGGWIDSLETLIKQNKEVEYILKTGDYSNTHSFDEL